MRVAIIPARGGSKRIPRKNIKMFAGKPIIAWSIRTALESGCFDHVIVSTDDVEIAEIAKEYGAEIPFMRSKSLGGDHVGTIPVVADALEYIHRERFFGDIDVEYACCIYPTAPLLEAQDLQQGLALLEESDASYVFPLAQYPAPLERALRLIDGRVQMLNPTHFGTRSQDLEGAWYDAGQFYWGRTHSWCNSEVIFSEKAIGFPMPRQKVQDIDDLEDWSVAEALFHYKHQQGKVGGYSD